MKKNIRKKISSIGIIGILLCSCLLAQVSLSQNTIRAVQEKHSGSPRDAPLEDTPTNLRGWHTGGQTFLVWEHSSDDPPFIYEVYSSTQPITILSDATLIGSVFSNNGENYRLSDYLPGFRWNLPTSTGESYSVGGKEAYFVITPYQEGQQYYAVVPSGGSSVGPNNTIGPL